MTADPREVLDLGLEIGCGMLAHGASVSSAIRASRHAMRDLGMAEYHTDVTGNMIIVSVRGETDGEPLTAMRVVPIGHQDFELITMLQQVASEARNNSIPDSRARIEAILGRHGRWGGLDVSLGFGAVSSAAALMFGARWIVGLLALIVAWSIHRTQVWLSKRRVSVFFQQCVGGAMAAAAAVGVALAKGWGVPGLAGIEPGLIVIGAIISMLAGLAILGASEDAISGLYVTGTAHAIHGLIVTIGLVIGASVVVAGASWLGIPVWINAQFSIDGLLGPVSVFWSGIVAAAWAFCTRASRRAIVSAGLIGAASWWLFLWLLAQRWPVVAATGAAALLVGMASAVAARLLRVQLDSISASAVVPILPGLVTWSGVLKLALGKGESSFVDGQQDLMTAAAVGIILAAGVAAGAAMARPMSVPIRKLPWPIRPLGSRGAWKR
ncbi:threonine/serine ThrE exporter family protein [[Pseudopropionibacterium] massiliense]|uniref:threonine/serine ThrE exporter family protein n=1 Tax=[Pseudopropionibacterium] massiliense TaxID=2220000 RepID=UPI00103158B7|nr:threonine/serine exporter family protein [[Pseudopropionibacterium] massiliense]